MNEAVLQRLSRAPGRRLLRVLWNRQMAWGIALTLLFIPAYWLASSDLVAPFGHGYASLHILLELPAIAVSLMVFLLAWSLMYQENRLRRIVLGAGFLCIALVDLAHTMSYSGMPFFLAESAVDRPTFLWLAGRFVAILVLFGVVFLPRRVIAVRKSYAIFLLSFVLSALIWYVAFFAIGKIPALFVPGEGLTPLKIGAEYLLTIAFAMASILLFRQGRAEKNDNLLWLGAASWVHALSEMFFTFYADVTDLHNVLGHLYKVVSYGLVYRGLFYSGVRLPYRILEMERSRLDTLLSTIPDPVWLKNEAGIYLACNAAFGRLVQRTEEQIIGRRDEDLFGESLGIFYRRRDRMALEHGRPVRNEEIIPQPGGGVRQYETTKTPMYLSDGELIGVLGIAHDITEIREAEKELRLAAKTFEANIGLFITDASQCILRVNPAFTQITGYTADELIGKTPRIFQSGRQNRSFYSAMWKEINEAGVWQGEIYNRRKNGEVYPEWLMISQVKGAAGEVTHYVASCSDLSENKAAAETIERLSLYDPLTELPNRKLMMDRLRQLIASVEERRRQGALLLLDLDDFKVINESYGHTVGDSLLVEAGKRLKSVLHGGDTVSHPGGDEFIVILDNLDRGDVGARQAESTALRLQEALSLPFVLEDASSERQFQYYCSTSIGVVLFTDSALSPDELLKRCDTALYSAKSAGRGHVRFFDMQMQATVVNRSSILEDLHRAVREGHLFVQYQPQVNESGRVIGAEALVRWRHPVSGVIPPGRFIPIAEESGLIVAIGQFVFETACRQLALWKNDERFSHLTLAVNVSAQQVKVPHLTRWVKRLLNETGALPEKLKLELTESMLFSDTDEVIERMNELKAIGLKFSLDDFGTGYSSLSYLRRLPLDQVKIDQSFVADLLHIQANQAIARTIIQLGENLGLTVLAEGVETEEQRDFLVGHGCRAFQGYLFSPPLDLEEFEAYVGRSSE